MSLLMLNPHVARSEYEQIAHSPAGAWSQPRLKAVRWKSLPGPHIKSSNQRLLRHVTARTTARLQGMESTWRPPVNGHQVNGRSVGPPVTSQKPDH